MRARVIGYEEDLLRAQTLEDLKCGTCKSCSQGEGGKIILVQSSRPYPLDAIIHIEMDRGNLLLAAFLAFGIPALMLILGAFIFEGTRILIAFVLIGIYYLVLHLNNQRLQQSRRFCARVVERKTYEFKVLR